MRRDPDLVRKLLLYFEGRQSFAVDREVRIEGYSDDDVQYHLLLLAQSGFITYEADRSTTNPERLIRVYPFGLSWAGHEFLDVARDDTAWRKATGKVAEATGGLSLDLLKELLVTYGKQALGLGA